MILKEEATKIFENTVESRREEYEANTIDFCDNFLTAKIKERATAGYREYEFSIKPISSIVGDNEVYDIRAVPNCTPRISLSKLKDILTKSGYEFTLSSCRYYITVKW